MKKSVLLLFACVITMAVKSQTYVYKAKADGTKDTKDYYYYDHTSGKAYKSWGGKEKERIADVLVKVEGTKIFINNEKTEKKNQIGFLSSNNEIITLKYSNSTSHEVNTEVYIKNHKIYRLQGQNEVIIGIIEGKEIYGVFSYFDKQF